MRLVEIQNLTWDQVDFLNGLISLRVGETKNGGARTIPVVPQLRALLQEQFGKRSDCPYVCFRMERTGQSVKLGYLGSRNLVGVFALRHHVEERCA